MKDFKQFAAIVKSPEIQSEFSKHLNSKRSAIPVPDFCSEEDVNSIMSFIASMSADISLSLLQYYHQWINLDDN